MSSPLLALLQSPFRSSISSSDHRAPARISQSPSDSKDFLPPILAPIALAFALSCSASPSLAAEKPSSIITSLLDPTTPFSQSRKLETGLENGKIRPCPSTNPSCVSSNPKSSSFLFPWVIPEGASSNAVAKLRDAILKTQRNANISVDEDTPEGHYLRVEVDGGFGRDVIEFLIKNDVVSFRSMANKVTYIYPFTTAFGDSSGQKERLKNIMEELGWYAPSFESMD